MTITPAGKRDRYITIWRDTSDETTPASDGSVTQTYTKIANVWGSITNISKPTMDGVGLAGQVEYYLFYHMQTEARFVAVVPFLEDVTSVDKITEEWKGKIRTYQITGPPYDTNDELIIGLNEIPPIGVQ